VQIRVVNLDWRPTSTFVFRREDERQIGEALLEDVDGRSCEAEEARVVDDRRRLVTVASNSL